MEMLIDFLLYTPILCFHLVERRQMGQALEDDNVTRSQFYHCYSTHISNSFCALFTTIFSVSYLMFSSIESTDFITKWNSMITYSNSISPRCIPCNNPDYNILAIPTLPKVSEPSTLRQQVVYWFNLVPHRTCIC